MKTRVRLMFLTVGTVLLMIAASSATIGGTSPPTSSKIYECEYNLLAGQTIDAGYILIWDVRESDGDHWLYVKFVTEHGWYLDETHLAYGDDLSDIPQTKSGSPKVGNFELSEDHPAGTTEYTYTIDLVAFDEAYGETNLVHDELFIAAHAVVYKGSGDTFQEETAWGKGDKFQKSWAMYMRFPCCPKDEDVDLPDEIISVTPTYVYPISGAKSYWSFKFDIDTAEETAFMWDNIVLPGWCFEEGIYMTSGTTYTETSYDIKFYLSTATDLPSRYSAIEWDKINYLINHKNSYTTAQIQQAIWEFADEPSGQENVAWADADFYGDGYYPQKGGLIAIILEIDDPNSTTEIQGTFFELDP